MSLNLIFHISDFQNLKLVNNIFFFIFEGGLIILYRGVYGGLFQNWHHKLMKYIIGKHHWGNKTIKPRYFFKPMYVIIYYQNQL